MSDGTSAPPPLPPRPRDGCLVISLVLVGTVLLLPGICALAFLPSDPKGMLTDPIGVTLLLTCLVVSAGGVALIWMAVGRPRP